MKSLFYLFIVSLLSFNVYAERNMQTKDGKVKRSDLSSAYNSAFKQTGITGLNLDYEVYATGVQIYEVQDNKWSLKAPGADLHTIQSRANRAVTSQSKVGFHGIHYQKPFWRFTKNGVDIELVAKKATPVDGASDLDVSWLVVELQDNPHGYKYVLRVFTRSGKAPSSANYTDGLRYGSPYQTVYSFWK